jgi:DNA polymerase-4
MNAFFASAEIAENPSLKGKPVVVAGNSRRGIILTASYEARKYGLHAAMPIFQAEKLCPKLIIQPPNFELYKKHSQIFFEYISKHCDKFEPASIDEAYLDVTETSKIYDSPVDLANKIQRELLEIHNLPVSIGIAPNRFLAKMASDMKKPLGITIMRKRDIKQKLWPLPIEDMYGIGKKTYPRLQNIGVFKIGDLFDPTKEKLLREILGNGYNSTIHKAMGESSSFVDDATHELQQIGNSRTFQRNTNDEAEIKRMLIWLVETVHGRMAKKSFMSRTFQISFKYERTSSVSRSHTFQEPLDDIETMKNIALDLFDRNWNGSEIRLIGFSTGEVIHKSEVTKQLDLFNFQDEKEKTDSEKLVEKLQMKFGEDMIKKGSS